MPVGLLPRLTASSCRVGWQRQPSLRPGDGVATAMGLDVSIPVTESAAYDIVVDDGVRLRRVQCKYCGVARSQDLRQIHSNSTGYVVKLVPRDAYDWLYILCSDEREYL